MSDGDPSSKFTKLDQNEWNALHCPVNDHGHYVPNLSYKWHEHLVVELRHRVRQLNPLGMVNMPSKLEPLSKEVSELVEHIHFVGRQISWQEFTKRKLPLLVELLFRSHAFLVTLSINAGTAYGDNPIAEPEWMAASPDLREKVIRSLDAFAAAVSRAPSCAGPSPFKCLTYRGKLQISVKPSGSRFRFGAVTQVLSLG
ncbi:hypothetical protein JCM16303_005196 [Sporobolomyces ruberrimus]